MYVGRHVKYSYSFQILMKLEFSRQTFEKYWNIKFHDNALGGAELFNEDRRTDKDEAHSRFPHFCEIT